jgi:NADH dehydrogenase
VESSGTVAEIARQTLKNDFRSINPEEAQIRLLDGAPRVLLPFPPVQDLTFSRGSRLITGAAPSDFNFTQEL